MNWYAASGNNAGVKLSSRCASAKFGVQQLTITQEPPNGGDRKPQALASSRKPRNASAKDSRVAVLANCSRQAMLAAGIQLRATRMKNLLAPTPTIENEFFENPEIDWQPQMGERHAN